MIDTKYSIGPEKAYTVVAQLQRTKRIAVVPFISAEAIGPDFRGARLRGPVRGFTGGPIWTPTGTWPL